MPYFFIDIEKEKSHAIKGVMFMLFLTYFIFFIMLMVIMKFLVAIVAFSLIDHPASSSLTENPFAFNLTPHPPGAFYTYLFSNTIYFLGVISIFALLITIVHWQFVAFRLTERIRRLLRVLPLPGLDVKTKEFYDIIQELKVAGGRRMKISGLIIPSKAMNAFSFSDWDENHYIGVTQGLLDRFSRAQLESVIAHEAAHIFIGDNLDRTMASITFGFFTKLSDEAKDLTPEGLDDILPNPFQAFFNIPKGLTRLMAMFINRERESRADIVAAKMTRDPLSLAESLYIIDRFSPEDKLISGIFEAIFIVSPEENLLDYQKGLWADLFSTHPPIYERIEVLLAMAHEDLKTMKERLLKDKEKIS